MQDVKHQRFSSEKNQKVNIKQQIYYSLVESFLSRPSKKTCNQMKCKEQDASRIRLKALVVSKEKNIFFLTFLIYINFNFTLRYFKIDGIGDTTLWETAIKNYRFEKSSEQPVSLDSITSNIPQGNLSLSEQCTLLSAFPNYHHWTSKKKPRSEKR